MSEPTPSTAKRLAALSLNRCAFPGCPTMMVDPKYRTFQGDVCHIRSRKGKGPRHDPSYTEDFNAEANLILLCKVHNAVIDDPHNLHLFPILILEQWKQDIDVRAVNYPHTDLEDTIARGIQESLEFKIIEDKEGARIDVGAGRILQCDGAEDFAFINAKNRGNTFATIRSVTVGYPDQSYSNEESRTLRYTDISLEGNSEYEFPVVRVSTLLSKFAQETGSGLVFRGVSSNRPCNMTARGIAIILDYENLFRSKTRLITSLFILFEAPLLGGGT